MAASMTAFARRESETPMGVMTWELRSVNHRYLDVSLRIPDELRAMEAAARERIVARLSRGKIDGFFRLRPSTEAGFKLTLNEALVAELVGLSAAVHHQWGVHAGLNSGLTVADVLRWPGAVQSAEANLEGVQRGAMTLLDQVLADLSDSRQREGNQLVTGMLRRCDTITELVGVTRTRLPDMLDLYRKRLRTRLAELASELDPQRLEQEMVLLAQKFDVAEELDRIVVHLDEVRRVLQQAGPVGRRLDFLMQELNREANTLGSKSVDIETTRASVDIKVLIEQMREQMQNIE